MSRSTSTSLNIHFVKRIEAHSNKTSGAPITLTFWGGARDDSAPDTITAFIDDQTLADRLVEAINRVMTERKAEAELSEVHSG